MIELITKNTLLYKRSEVWFYNNQEIQDAQNTLFYHSLVVPSFKTVSLSEITSLVIDLQQDENKILGGIKTNYRNEIRRAETEGVKFEINASPDETELMVYLISYEAFEKFKNIGGGVDFLRMQAFMLKNNFIITKTSYNNSDLTYHSYLVDSDNTAILFQSHHNLDAPDSNLRGYANKFHHWNDLLYFRNQAVQNYDFGGLDFINTAGIAKYKCGFGGEIVKRFHFQRTMGLYKILKG